MSEERKYWLVIRPTISEWGEKGEYFAGFFDTPCTEGEVYQFYETSKALFPNHWPKPKQLVGFDNLDELRVLRDFINGTTEDK